MLGIENKAIVLKLNRLWQPVGFGIVADAIVDLCAGVSLAVDMEYKLIDGKPDFNEVISMNAVNWDEWIKLPVRSWDFSISSPSMTIRVPTVLISKVFASMPIRRFNGNPNRNGVWLRDRGIDQYTGKPLKESEASVDHVIPKSRGGSNHWDNVVLTHKKINYLKGSHLNSEVGLKLVKRPTAPQPLPASALITIPKHPDWKVFLMEK